MVELGRPGGLGGFQVLVQGKCDPMAELWGLERSVEAADLVEALPVPLLAARHLSLPRGRYPNSELEIDLEFGADWTFDG